LDPTSANSSGLEISIDRSSGPLTWWASYTLSKATDRIEGEDQLRSWDQRHAVQGGIAWRNDNWDVALAGSVHTGWPATDLEVIETGVDPDGEPEFVAIPGPRNAPASTLTVNQNSLQFRARGMPCDSEHSRAWIFV
jgi:hypothetical protein